MPHLASNHLIITKIFVLHNGENQKNTFPCIRLDDVIVVVWWLEYCFPCMYLNNKVLTIEIFSNMLLLLNTHIVISFLIFFFSFFFCCSPVKRFYFHLSSWKTYEVFIEICVIYWSRNSFGILLLLYVMPVYYMELFEEYLWLFYIATFYL